MTPTVVGWPRRTAGERTRVIALAAGESVDSVVLDALTKLASDAFAITLATVGPAPVALPPGIAQLLLPATDAAAGKAIAALDADVLVDIDGMAAATLTLLAQHPARNVWTFASLPHSKPLVDRSFENTEALAAAVPLAA